MRKTKGKRAVFLDRDGTIIREVSYLRDIRDLRLLPGAASAISMLNAAGFKVVVITNQSGVARGFFDVPFVEKVHAEIDFRLKKKGARIDAWYFCPHHPEKGSKPYRKRCRCRKPEIGLIEKACRELHLDVRSSYMIGDSFRDIEAGWRSRLNSILVLTGYGKLTYNGLSLREKTRISYIAKNLIDASRWILQLTNAPHQES